MSSKKFLIFLLILLLAGCANQKNPTITERTELAMGTVITLKANGINSDSAVDAAFTKIFELEKLINDDIKKIEAADDFVQVSPDVFKMLQTAQIYSELTGGAFDVTVSDFRKLHLRNSDLSVRLEYPNMKIDLGGIAKGYGVDLVRQIFAEHGITDGLIDFGTSTIYALGKKRIGIKNPQKPDELIDIVEVEDSAISTSGDYIQHQHIIDPRTGLPADSGLSSVSIIVDGSIENCAMVADILSTAAFVMGRENFINASVGLELVAHFDFLDGKVLLVKLGRLNH